MLPIVGLVVTIVGVALAVFFWIDPELQRVRAAIRSAKPEIECTIGTYGWPGGAGLHAAIHNRGVSMAHCLRLAITSMPGQVWEQDHLAPNDWARPQIPVHDDAALRTTKLEDPVAILRYKDHYDNDYGLRVELIQTERDDGKFNLGSDKSTKLGPPALGRLELWRLRTKI